MKIFALAILMIFSLLVFDTTRAQSKSENTVTTKDEIIKLYKEFYAADKASDTKLLAPYLADDYVWISVEGEQGTKASRLQGIKERPQDLSFTRAESDYNYHIFGETVVVTSRQSITFTMNGNTGSLDVKQTDVWLKRKGTWQLIFSQSTPNETK